MLARTPCAPAGRRELAACGVLQPASEKRPLKSKDLRVKENQFPVTLKPQAYLDQTSSGAASLGRRRQLLGLIPSTPGTVVRALPLLSPDVWAGRQLVAAVRSLAFIWRVMDAQPWWGSPMEWLVASAALKPSPQWWAVRLQQGPGYWQGQ